MSGTSVKDATGLDATGEGGKYGQGRSLADAALRAEAEGEPQADLLAAEADRTDPQAVANALDQEDMVKGAAKGDAAGMTPTRTSGSGQGRSG